MDFKVKEMELKFIETDILSRYLVFYMSDEWYKYKRLVLISNADGLKSELIMDKNYVEIPQKFSENKLLSIQLVGYNELGEKIITNKVNGRR